MATNFEIFAAVDAYRRLGEMPSGRLSHSAPDGRPVRIATDGSTLSHALSQGPTGWAYYVDDQVWRAGTLNAATSQCGELTAVLHAITEAPSTRQLVVVTDSRYVAELVQSVSPDGHRNLRLFRMSARADWVSVARLLVASIELRPGKVTVERVRAHRGPATALENQMADHLARRARWSAMSQLGLPMSRAQRLVDDISEQRRLATSDFANPTVEDTQSGTTAVLSAA